MNPSTITSFEEVCALVPVSYQSPTEPADGHVVLFTPPKIIPLDADISPAISILS